MNSYRVTWETKAGETGDIIIEAESKGQARRVFIQSKGGGEDGRSVTGIEAVVNRPELSLVGTEILAALENSGCRFFISGLDILAKYMHHIPESFPVLLYHDRHSHEQIQDLLIQRQIVPGSYRDMRVLHLVNRIDGIKGIALLRPARSFKHTVNGLAVPEKAFADIYYESMYHGYPLSIQETHRIYDSMRRRNVLNLELLMEIVYRTGKIQQDIKRFVDEYEESNKP